MFIGHYAVALAAKTFKPQVSLGIYFLAAQFADLLWPVLLLLNIEVVAIEPGITAMTPLNFISYPYSHSLLMIVVWSFTATAIIYMWKHNFSVALTVGLVVGSHWLLDFASHAPDLPLTFNQSYKVGLGLWNFKVASAIIEVLMFVTAVVVYIRSTISNDAIGKYSIWALAFLMLTIYAANIFGPVPPSVNAIAWSGNLQWLFVLWAFWMSKHRTHSGFSMHSEVSNS